MIETCLNVVRLVERSLAVFLFTVMLALYFVNIVVRIFLPSLSASIAWVEDLSQLAMVWGIFIVAGLTLERGRHIAMSSLVATFRPAVRFAIRRTIGVVGALFFAYLAYLAVKMTSFVFKTGQVIPSLDISSAYIYMGAVSGLGLLALRYALEIWRPMDPADAPVEG